MPGLEESFYSAGHGEKSTKVSEQRISMAPMAERTAGSKEQQQESQPGMKLPSRQELGIVNVRIKNRRYKKKINPLKTYFNTTCSFYQRNC